LIESARLRAHSAARARVARLGLAGLATLASGFAGAPAQAAVPFSAPLGLYAGSVPASVAVGDLNGDRRPDIVSTDSVCTNVALYAPGNCSGENGLVWVRLGGPLGTFTPPLSYQVGPDPDNLVLANFNGHADIVVETHGSPEATAVLLGNGLGGFTAGPTLTGAYGPIAVGDFSGSGHHDLVTADGRGGGIAIYPGDGNGGFGAPTTLAINNVAGLAAADLNGDGHADLVVTQVANPSTFPNPGYSFKAEVLWGDGHGGFSGSTALTGDASMVTPSNGTAPYLDGAGTVMVTDLNGDGHPDIVALDAIGGTGRSWLGDGHGGFASPQMFSLSGGPIVGSPVIADFNGDGHPDIATSDTYGTFSVALGDGNGGFEAPQTVQTGGGFGTSIAAGDFLGNGLPGIAAVDTTTTSGGPTGYQPEPYVGLSELFNLTPPAWWPSAAAGAWPGVLAQWVSGAFPPGVVPWNVSAWLPQPAVQAWQTIATPLGLKADGTRAHRVALSGLGHARVPAWLTPRRVHRWAAAWPRRHRHR
jgi:hypothetical protein